MLKYNLSHVKGLYFEITEDDGKGKEYDVQVVEADGKVIYSTKMKVNHWLRLERKYLSDLRVIVRYQGRTITEVSLLKELKGKRVFISYESKSLGDSIAWMPYCLEFQKHYECEVIVSTFKNFLFEKAYPELQFADRGVVVKNIVAMFELGWFWEKSKEPVNPVTIPLQQAASNILLLPFKEIQSKVYYEVKERPIKNKYICISIHSTSGCKYWDYWQELVDYLVSKGYEVIEVSNEASHLNNLTEFTDKSMPSTMNAIHHSEFVIGLSSGISWLSWAMNKQVVMISNFTESSHEFTSNCVRINNLSVCNSCWNDPMFRFDKGNWKWCPRMEDTPRAFECHKSISSKDVIQKISHLIN
jgi:autotransporter strand-loop-strand O-heptosyltransferase